MVGWQAAQKGEKDTEVPIQLESMLGGKEK